MKIIAILVLSCLISSISNAQIKVFKIPQKTPFVKVQPKAITNQDTALLKSILRNRVLSEIRNEVGFIILPLDNMPCLVTTINSNMPIVTGLAGFPQPITIPHAPLPFPKSFKTTVPE